MRIRVVASACVLAMVVAACGTEVDQPEVTGTPDPDPTPAEGATPDEDTAEEDEEVADGGTLVVAISSDPGHLNPAITTQGGTHTASEIIFNGLVSLDDDLNAEPDLAESWEITDDGATYTFTLRGDVTWHDGEPFTSADVVWTFENALLEYHSRTRASMDEALESIEALDEHTVVFSFAFPYAPLLLQLDVTEAPILPVHIYEGTDPEENEEANRNPVGTGPFRFVSYTPDSEIRLERNPDYHKDGMPDLDELVMRVIPDESSQVIALEAGEVDWLWGVPGPDLERLAGEDAFETLQTNRNPGGSNCIMTVSYNLDREMFQDVNVRRAIALALDQEAFLERVLFGAGAVAEAPISSGIPFGHAEEVDVPGYDVEEAERLLEEAGWMRDGDGTRTAQGVEGVDDGTELAFDFLHFPTFAQYGELYRAQLGEIGAGVELRAMEPPVFVETVFTERDFDTSIVSYCNGNDPEIGVRRMYVSDNIAPIPFSNSSAYRNDRIDELFDEAQQTVELDDRAEVYREISEILVEELPYYWLVETVATRVHRAECSGFRGDGHFAETASCDG
jgi:peptide/nickel transport system substrate-binding protein